MKWTFEIHPSHSAELEALIEEAGVDHKEFVNNALTLLKWAIKTTRAGKTVAAIDEANKHYVEIEMPLLAQFRPK